MNKINYTAKRIKFDKSLKIFFDSLLFQIFISKSVQKMSPTQRNKVAFSAGREFHLLVKKYTGIDTYKKEDKL